MSRWDDKDERMSEWLAAERWERRGEAGVHRDHRLHADEMGDVWCLDCFAPDQSSHALSDREALRAWPTEQETETPAARDRALARDRAGDGDAV